MFSSGAFLNLESLVVDCMRRASLARKEVVEEWLVPGVICLKSDLFGDLAE